jgi:alpha-1,3-rhamnosyltransferase
MFNSKVNPLVSIVVPSYNHASFIKQCIESIVNQDFTNYELIVIDDGSKDDSPQILAELQKKYGFLLLLNKNQGLARTLNQGFRDLAKGEYYTFCASDDYWLPGKLSKQVAFMEQHHEYGMVYGNAIFVNEENVIDEERTREVPTRLKGGNIFKELINIEFHPPVNYLLRASIVKSVGYYRENIWAEDFDMNLMIGSKHPIGYINDFLSAYRVDTQLKNKNLTFNTIYSHRDSISQFKDTPYFREAMKNWYFRCFTWYAPYTAGKKLAFRGMINNLDKIFTKDFIISVILLLFKWYK